MSKSVTNSCNACGEERKSRSREFSPHALSALILWGELDQNSVGQPVCEGCYREFRDLLIERTDELERMAPPALSDYAGVLEIPAYTAISLNDAQIAS
ncbi:MAG: hypothetical protein NTX25_05150 [Proteobacteria bacterium]|nr:hypothetical protein [Pseudomonadota bacterium]